MGRFRCCMFTKPIQTDLHFVITSTSFIRVRISNCCLVYIGILRTWMNSEAIWWEMRAIVAIRHRLSSRRRIQSLLTAERMTCLMDSSVILQACNETGAI